MNIKLLSLHIDKKKHKKKVECQLVKHATFKVVLFSNKMRAKSQIKFYS